MKYIIIILVLAFVVPFAGCRSGVKMQEDQLYSRHLQEHVKLTILSTPRPEEIGDINVLLLNDGQDYEKLGVKKVLDSLYSKHLIEPLIIICIHSSDRMKEYGVADQPDYLNNGSSAGKYSLFIEDELYPFIKKKSGIRKFSSIAIAGCSLGGLSAFDIGWDHADKIDKVGVFSGSFWWRDKNANDSTYSDLQNRIMLSKIKSSRKKPQLAYWFYVGGKEEQADRDKDGIIDVIDDTKDLIEIIKNKKLPGPQDIVLVEDPNGIHDYSSWRKHLAEFLLWAFHA